MNRALIVDDHDGNRYLLRALLQGHGFVVDEASHGAEALVLARANPPTLVISDLLMPVMDGYTLLRQWRSDDRLRAIPFIVYTATYTEPSDERLALSLGADVFLIKPSEPEPFMARVRDALAAVTRIRPADVAAPTGDDANLRAYNQTLIRKLEAKTQQLQQANQTLVDDAHQRLIAEQGLREQKQFLDTILACSPECVKVMDGQGNLERMNAAGLAMLEVSSVDEAQRHGLMNFLLPDHRGAFIAFLHQVCAGKAGTLVFPVVGRLGTRRWLESHAVPLRDERRGTTLLLGITRDITDRLRLENELRQTQKMEAIGRLAGGIAHDFNNQLMVIQGYGTMALSHAADDKTRKYAACIIQAAERSADLVRQLLAFSRRDRPTMAVVDLHRLISETVEVLTRTLNHKLHLVSHLTATDARILGDASLLQNALLNLALNARDAMPHGGELRFATTLIDATGASHPGTHLGAGADQPQPRLRLTVSDSGQGMTADVLEHLFEPFFSTKAAGHGTGLGLASVHATITQHGGTIAVASESGRGTTFTLDFPPLPSGQTAAPPAPDRPALGMTGGGRSILVIDDEPLVASLAADGLTAHGYQVTCVNDPVDALAHYQKHWRGIALVLLDYNMPNLSGAEVFDALRLTNPQAIVLLASGFREDGAIATLIANGAAGFLAKPFSPDELAHRVAQLLGGARSA